jgi:hypothetical protein
LDAHPAQAIINDHELPRRPVDAKPLKYKCRGGKVTLKNTVYLQVYLSSPHKWGARWSDGQEEVFRKGGFPTDLAAARHAAEKNVRRRIPAHLHSESIPVVTALSERSYSLSTCAAPFDEHTFVSSFLLLLPLIFALKLTLATTASFGHSANHAWCLLLQEC